MIQLKIDFNNSEHFDTNKLETLSVKAKEAQTLLKTRSGKGSTFLGWLDLPSTFLQAEMDRINETASRLKSNSDFIVVTGIGGSYLGAKAVIEALKNSFSGFQSKSENPHIIYAGHHLCGEYHKELLDFLHDKEYSVVVISKSGTTTEPAIAFRLLKNQLESKYGKKAASERIVAVTDQAKGALKNIADEEGYTTYVIPDNVGGRFSVLTPVGLLPVAAAGFNIKALLAGAAEMELLLNREMSLSTNPALMYACIRNLMYQSGKTTEVLVNYYPRLTYLAEWWKQLFGESEGKDGKGIFPASVNFTTDLHSLGQYIQDGLRNIFETTLVVEKTNFDVVIPSQSDDKDGLNYIAGKSMNYVNQKAMEGTILAHEGGSVPNSSISVPEINEHILGQLIYFFEYSCALSGYMLGVNPFDQPGVEAYKNNMFRLLGKPGF